MQTRPTWAMFSLDATLAIVSLLLVGFAHWTADAGKTHRSAEADVLVRLREHEPEAQLRADVGAERAPQPRRHRLVEVDQHRQHARHPLARLEPVAARSHGA